MVNRRLQPHIYKLSSAEVLRSIYIQYRQLADCCIASNRYDLTFQNIFDEIDSDKDGKINFKDFKAMMLY